MSLLLEYCFPEKLLSNYLECFKIVYLPPISQFVKPSTKIKLMFLVWLCYHLAYLTYK